MKKAEHNYTEFAISKAKEFRSDMTLFEQKLWFHLGAKRFNNLKFRRQVPIGNYIVDFVCKEKKLIIELDGSEHLDENQMLHDINRDEYLKTLGYKILRIYNNDINKDINIVLETIKQAAS